MIYLDYWLQKVREAQVDMGPILLRQAGMK